MKEEQKRKGLFILPNLFTTANLFAGFLGLLWAVEGKFVYAALAILVSCVCDGLDGKIARMTKGGSSFGVQMDSLADLVAFGVTPSILIYMWQTQIYGRLAIALSFMFVACGALRLARFNVKSLFNVQTSKKSFQGLPIPAAACVISTLVLFSSYFPQTLISKVFPPLCLALLISTSLLMVSRVPYTSFKEFDFLKAHPFSATLGLVFVFVLFASEPEFFGFILFSAYLLSGPVQSYILAPLRNGSFLRGLSAKSPRN